MGVPILGYRNIIDSYIYRCSRLFLKAITLELLNKHFPDLTEDQLKKFQDLEGLYQHWNAQINVISRKDMDQFFNHHVLHSLAIGLFTTFNPGATVLDVGTGGGFPGIPLAILFPEVTFHLVDSIGKKIKVVKAVTESLGLQNVTSAHIRGEEVKGSFDYVVSRAVTKLTPFYAWIEDKIDFSRFTNSGLYALKGGDLKEEIKGFEGNYRQAHVASYEISEQLEDPYFETKKIVFVN